MVFSINQYDIQLVYAGGDNNTSVEYLRHLIITQKANINAQNRENETAIHRAVRISRVNLVKFLFENNPDLSLGDQNGHTAYDIALLKKNKEIIQILRVPTKVVLSTENDLYFLYSCRSRNLTGVKEAVRNGADLSAYNINEVTGLHFAALFGHFRVVDFLIEQKADLNSLDQYKASSLDYALMNDNLNAHYIVNKLIASGAEYNSKGNSSDYSILYKVAFRGYVDTILLMRNITNINEASVEEGDTALHIAAFYGNTNIAVILLAKGSNLALKNREGLTAYDIADNLGYKNITKILSHSVTKLMYYSAFGKMKILEKLLKNIKTPNIEFYYKQTALNLAVQYNREEVVKLLLDSGATSSLNEFGEHPLMLSASNHNCNITDILLTSFLKRGIKFLVEENIYHHVMLECGLTKFEDNFKYVGALPPNSEEL